MKFKLFQFQVSDELHNRINALGWTREDPEIMAKLEASMGNAYPGLECGLYKHVATITADDLEGVFHVGNVGPESCIDRIDHDTHPMHSVSVGDIVIDPMKNAYVVASMGFSPVVMPAGYEFNEQPSSAPTI